MAASATAGCLYRSPSISKTGTFSPPRMSTSLVRPLMRMYPSSSLYATSPLSNQPSSSPAEMSGRL